MQGGGLAGFQMGGKTSWLDRAGYQDEISMPHGRFINSSIAGRTDRLPVVTAANGFVVPAAEVSGLGQGNTLSGAKILSAALRTGPYGTDLPHLAHHQTIPRPPSLPGGLRQLGESRGGRGDNSQSGASHIMVAGGEALIPPHDWVGQDPEDGRFYWHRGVQSIGEGDIDEARRACVRWSRTSGTTRSRR
jgi:hypothetical protein